MIYKFIPLNDRLTAGKLGTSPLRASPLSRLPKVRIARLAGRSVWECTSRCSLVAAGLVIVFEDIEVLVGSDDKMSPHLFVVGR